MDKRKRKYAAARPYRRPWTHFEEYRIKKAIFYLGKDFNRIEPFLGTRESWQIRSYVRSLSNKTQLSAKLIHDDDNFHWNEKEIALFIEGLTIYGKGNWKEISKLIGTRSGVQIRSFFKKFTTIVNRFNDKVKFMLELSCPNSYQLLLANYRFMAVNDVKRIQRTHPTANKKLRAAWGIILQEKLMEMNIKPFRKQDFEPKLIPKIQSGFSFYHKGSNEGILSSQSKLRIDLNHISKKRILVPNSKTKVKYRPYKFDLKRTKSHSTGVFSDTPVFILQNNIYPFMLANNPVSRYENKEMFQYFTVEFPSIVAAIVDMEFNLISDHISLLLGSFDAYTSQYIIKDIIILEKSVIEKFSSGETSSFDFECSEETMYPIGIIDHSESRFPLQDDLEKFYSYSSFVSSFYSSSMEFPGLLLGLVTKENKFACSFYCCNFKHQLSHSQTSLPLILPIKYHHILSKDRKDFNLLFEKGTEIVDIFFSNFSQNNELYEIPEIFQNILERLSFIFSQKCNCYESLIASFFLQRFIRQWILNFEKFDDNHIPLLQEFAKSI
eukprot:TRINITY_DN2969_c2_g13_i1.p1 TRINITY_DN2969_c2_g13~~TRINITY_DN2969_c2_g13_i1.p1  ORF type:complete len:552 (+),score=127.78 TRINITY_DN2969_c2_g13_i1:41-1696(+)